MNPDHDRRCSNHPLREAVARCTGCGRYFCRECVAEHDDRMLCSACLADLLHHGRRHRFSLSGAMLAGQCMLSLFMAWLFFYYLALFVMSIPVPLHEGTIWSPEWWGIR